MAPADIAAYQKMEAQQKVRDWPNLCRYRAMNAVLAHEPATERRVIFMGDSITENWGLADPDFFTDGIVDRGISGQTTPQMLIRFRADVINLHPAAVHIMAGTNDIAGNTGPSTLAAIEDNLASMVEIARANNIRIILAATPPAKMFSWAPAIHPAEQIRALNTWIRTYAKAHDLTYADYYAPLATDDGAMSPDLTLDGVHPNRQGYRVMAPVARAAIASALDR